MNTQTIVKRWRELVDNSSKASQALTDYAKPFQGAMGLVPQEIRVSQEYRTMENNYLMTKNALMIFNKLYGKDKVIQKAIKEEILSQRFKRQ